MEDPPIVIQFQIREYDNSLWALLDDGTLWTREMKPGREWRWVPGPQAQWIEREVMLKQREDHPALYDQGDAE